MLEVDLFTWSTGRLVVSYLGKGPGISQMTCGVQTRRFGMPRPKYIQCKEFRSYDKIGTWNGLGIA